MLRKKHEAIQGRFVAVTQHIFLNVDLNRRFDRPYAVSFEPEDRIGSYTLPCIQTKLKYYSSALLKVFNIERE